MIDIDKPVKVKKHSVSARGTYAFKRAVQKRAAELGKTVSDYIRDLIIKDLKG